MVLVHNKGRYRAPLNDLGHRPFVFDQLSLQHLQMVRPVFNNFSDTIGIPVKYLINFINIQRTVAYFFFCRCLLRFYLKIIPQRHGLKMGN